MYLLLDIGGTKTRIAVSRDGQTIESSQTVPTNLNFTEAMAEIKAIASTLTGGEKITIAGGGVRALNRTKSELSPNPNFPMWVDEPLKKSLEDALKASVHLENDAGVCGLGEALFGAGKGKRIVVYMTVSTGVGGTRIIDGHIDPNALGYEPGNQIIDVDGSLFKGAPNPGYLEAYVSGTALKNRFNKPAHEIADKKVWDEMAKYLAYGLNNTIVHWSPDIIVFGGSLMEQLPLGRINHHLKTVLKIFPEPPPLVKAELGDERGLFGSLAFLKSKQ